MADPADPRPSRRPPTRKRISSYRLGWALGIYAVTCLAPLAAVADEPERDEPIDMPVPVEIVSPRPIELRELRLSGGPQPVLQVPASPGRGQGWQVQVHAASTLQVRAPGMTERSFKLERPWWMRVQVTPGRRRPYDAGLGLMVGGTLSAGLGVIMGLLGWGYQSRDYVVGPPGWVPLHERYLIAFGVTLPVGLASLIAGGVLTRGSATKIVQTPIRWVPPPPPVLLPAPAPTPPASAPLAEPTAPSRDPVPVPSPSLPVIRP